MLLPPKSVILSLLGDKKKAEHVLTRPAHLSNRVFLSQQFLLISPVKLQLSLLISLVNSLHRRDFRSHTRFNRTLKGAPTKSITKHYQTFFAYAYLLSA